MSERRTTGNCRGWHVFHSSRGKPPTRTSVGQMQLCFGTAARGGEGEGGPSSRFGEQEKRKGRRRRGVRTHTGSTHILTVNSLALRQNLKARLLLIKSLSPRTDPRLEDQHLVARKYKYKMRLTQLSNCDSGTLIFVLCQADLVYFGRASLLPSDGTARRRLQRGQVKSCQDRCQKS